MLSLLPTVRSSFVLLFCGCALALTAQVYHPFPRNGTWVFKHYDDFGHPLIGEDRFKTQGDTILNGHSYSKLHLNSAYYGAIRDSAKQVYYRAMEETAEHLLYDFNKAKGDTIIAPYPMEGLGYSCDTILVTGEDQFLTLDGSRRQLSLASCGGAQWIEGIGNTWWLTSPAYLGSLSGGSFLTCFFDSTQLIYALEGYQCISSTEEQVIVPGQLFFPNPTSGPLNLRVPANEPLTISVCDWTGRTLLYFPAARSSLDISNLPDGIYGLIVQSKTYRQTFKIVKRSNP